MQPPGPRSTEPSLKKTEIGSRRSRLTRISSITGRSEPGTFASLVSGANTGGKKLS